MTGVWVGAESPLVRFDNLQLGQGAATALPVWGEFMANVARTRGAAFRSGRFPAPPESVAARLRCDGNEEADGRKMSAVEAFFDRLFGGAGREAESRPEPAEPAEEGATPESVGGGEGEGSSAGTGARENERARRREEKAREREKKAAERRRENAKKAEERAREDAKKDAERSREDAKKDEERSREDAKKREEKQREREKKERERDND